MRQKIALVDDHRMFADGLQALLQSAHDDLSVTTFEEPIACLQAMDSGARFDLVIIDLVMKGMNGMALLAALRKLNPPPRVMVLSGMAATPPIAEIRRLGASGFVTKTADINELLAAIEAVIGGETVFPDPAEGGAEAPPDSEPSWHSSDPPPALGKRQLEVLRLIGQGVTNKEIAARLDISENTVKTHMRAIFEALDVRTRTACHHKAVLLGLI